VVYPEPPDDRRVPNLADVPAAITALPCPPVGALLLVPDVKVIAAVPPLM